jgi:hypothetical protein
MASGAGLTGALDPYDDPDCGCVIVTRFWGRVRGDVIEGTFASTNVQTKEVTRGEWKVKRRAARESAVSGGSR